MLAGNINTAIEQEKDYGTLVGLDMVISHFALICFIEGKKD